MEKKLPEGWEWKRLNDLVQFIYGYPFDSSKFNNEGRGTPLIRIRNLIKDKTDTFFDGEFEETYLVQNGDILIGMDGEFNIVRWGGEEALLNQRICKLDVTSSTLILSYAFRVLKKILKRIEDKTPHVTVKHLSAKQLNSIQIPFPPLETQRKIVAILEKSEETKKLRMQADELADRLLQSVFFEMFGDPVKNPKRFDFAQLKTVYSKEKPGTKCGPFGSALKKHEYVRHGIPVLTMDAICDNKFINKHDLFITKEKYEQLTPYLVEKGDIIISRAGTVGKMCVANPSVCPSIIGTNLIRLSLDFSKIEPIYFTSLMTYCKGRVGRLKSGSDGAYTFMNTGILNNLDIPLPPLALQQKFAQIVEKVEAMRQNQKQSRQEIDNLFNALMQKAFKGELVA